MAVIEAIETVYLETEVCEVQFDSLGSYEHLQLRYSTHSTSTSSNHYDSVIIRFATGGGGIDTGANYSIKQMYCAQATKAGNATVSQTSIYTAGMADTDASLTEEYGPTVVDILDYRNTSKNTVVIGLFSTGSLNYSTSYLILGGGMWDNAGAIDKINLSLYTGPDFARGSEFSLYGLNSS